LTDGYSMSGTEERNRRYMKLFVYLPVALHPHPERALLISYGVGSTARALLDTPGVEHVDVVDISREILETSEMLYDADRDPLRDPRTEVHIEDGRYFLQAHEGRYELITGEPPPPKIAGVVNLYTREYFQLIHDRLSDEGVSTYWLPVHNLTESDTLAILRAYCDVFRDCSLWAGSGLDWILMGTRGAPGRPTIDDFTEQWRSVPVLAELEAVGVERAEQLGAIFLADADDLREATAGTAPLVDDFPKRLANTLVDGSRLQEIYSPWMDTDRTRERFASSGAIAAVWPVSLVGPTLEAFERQRMIHETGITRWRARRLEDLHRVLTETELRTLPLWLMDTRGDEIRAAERLRSRGDARRVPKTLEAYDALADRRYTEAADHLAEAWRRAPRDRKLLELRVYALAMAGRPDEAREVARDAAVWVPRDGRDRWYREWMGEVFGLKWP
jgi:hypothetical protein